MAWNRLPLGLLATGLTALVLVLAFLALMESPLLQGPLGDGTSDGAAMMESVGPSRRQQEANDQLFTLQTKVQELQQQQEELQKQVQKLLQQPQQQQPQQQQQEQQQQALQQPQQPQQPQQQQQQESQQQQQQVPQSADAADQQARESAFTNIYRSSGWGAALESRSGAGSTVAYTSNIRTFMGVAFRLLGIRSLLDSPCGDCHWQPLIPGFNATNYTGVDIVKDVIDSDAAKYAGWPNMRFFQVDLAAQPVPPGPYDAVLCRDMIQHLPLQAGLGAFRTLEATGARYLFTNFHSETSQNKDTPPGGFEYLDPMLPPFNFPEPIMYAMEGADNAYSSATARVNYKMIGLWKLPALGRGTGQSICPINTAALEPRKLIVVDKEAAVELRKTGVTDFECHVPAAC